MSTAATDRRRRPLPGGQESIELLERGHGIALRRYLTWLTRGDFQRAEDIYQETLIRAWKHPQERDSEGRYGRNWLLTVARRIYIDQYRAAAIRPAEIADEDIAACPDRTDRIEQLLTAAEVRAAVATLSPDHRQVIYEMYFLDRPAAEIAERLGIPAGTVKSRTYYALRQLRSVLADRGQPALAS